MIILYFSGTGNSAYIAAQFAAKMNIPCHSIEDDVDFPLLLSASDTIAVCYPIYGSCVPRILRDFTAKHIEYFFNKKLIVFCTQMMFSGDGARAFTRLLPGSVDNVIYAEHFNMPNNICNFWLFPVKDAERIRKKRAADQKLTRVCDDISKGVIHRHGFGPFSTFLGKFQNTYWPKMEEKLKGSFSADKSCNQCGLCVRRCPADNLVIKENKICQKNKCTICYRCVNLCPQKAATVMLSAKPKRQYKGPK